MPTNRYLNPAEFYQQVGMNPSINPVTLSAALDDMYPERYGGNGPGSWNLAMAASSGGLNVGRILSMLEQERNRALSREKQDKELAFKGKWAPYQYAINPMEKRASNERISKWNRESADTRAEADRVSRERIAQQSQLGANQRAKGYREAQRESSMAADRRAQEAEKGRNLRHKETLDAQTKRVGLGKDPFTKMLESGIADPRQLSLAADKSQNMFAIKATAAVRPYSDNYAQLVHNRALYIKFVLNGKDPGPWLESLKGQATAPMASRLKGKWGEAQQPVVEMGPDTASRMELLDLMADEDLSDKYRMPRLSPWPRGQVY